MVVTFYVHDCIQKPEPFKGLSDIWLMHSYHRKYRATNIGFFFHFFCNFPFFFFFLSFIMKILKENLLIIFDIGRLGVEITLRDARLWEMLTMLTTPLKSGFPKLEF